MVLPLELPLQGRLIWLAGGKGRGGGRGAQGLPATRLHCLPLCCVPRRVAQVARVAGPLPQACLVVLRPLVEEKVKEQLEAAKPEPVIEEVVSGARSPSRLPGPLSPPCSPLSPCSSLCSLSTSLLPFSPVFLPLSPAFLRPLGLGPSSPDVHLPPPQDLANLAPRKPDW